MRSLFRSNPSIVIFLCTLSLILPHTGLAGEAKEKCIGEGKPRIIIPPNADKTRQMWLFKDSKGLEDLGTGTLVDFVRCPYVIDNDEAYQTIQLEHSEMGKVWIMRSGLALTSDDAAICLAEDNTSGTMGVRGMGEGCDK